MVVLLFLAISHTAYSQNIPEGEVENIVQENTDLILQYDENSDGDLSREEAQRADQDYEDGEITRNQAEQITRLSNIQASFKDYLIEAVVKENTDLIDQYDENSNGEISISELGVAGTDYGEEEVSSEELNYLELLANTDADYTEYIDESASENSQENSAVNSNTGDEVEDYIGVISIADDNFDQEIDTQEYSNAFQAFTQDDATYLNRNMVRAINKTFNYDGEYTDFIDNGMKQSAVDDLNVLQEYDTNSDGIATQDFSQALNDYVDSQMSLDKFNSIATFYWSEDTYQNFADSSSSETREGERVEASIDEWSDVNVGDTVVFGTDNQNELSIESMRESERRDFRYMELMPGIGPGTPSEDPLRIIFPEDEVRNTLGGVEFSSGRFRIEVEDFSVQSQSAGVKLVPDYSESSDFDCMDYDLGENQYAFCSNGDEEVERGETQNIDLGFESVETDFNYNHVAQYGGEPKRASIFTFANGPTFTVRHDSGGTYRGADFEVLEWRGDLDEYDGANMQAIIEVDPVEEPEASLNFGKTNYEPGEGVNLNYEAFEPGKYELRVSGAGQDRTESYGESTTEDALSFEASEEGEINAELVAPGSWWNPLDSDRTVAEASAEVKRPFSEVNHEFGEKFSISEDQSTQIEGKNFYLRSLAGSSENGYPSILWRSSEDSNTNSGLTLLRRVDSMGVQYDDGFNAYGVVCSIDPETDSAEIIVKENRFNPWEACDRHPDELRSDNDYEIKDYILGEKVSLEPGEGLEFGDSRVYLDELEEFGDRILPEGYKEWKNEPASPSHWNPSAEGYTMTEYFYEGRISTATCEMNSEEIEIVMEKTSETGSNWPEAACGNADENDEAFASIIEGSLSTENSQTTFSMTVESSEADGIFSAYWDTPDGERVAFTSNAQIGPGETKTFTESVSNGDIDVETPVEVNANFGGRVSEQIGTLELGNNNENICTYQMTGNIENTEYDRDKTQRVYNVVNGEESGFTSLTATEEFDWTTTAPCGTTQRLEYRENGETLASKEVDLPENGREVTETLVVQSDQNTNEESSEDQNITLEIPGSEPFSVNQEVNITATVTNEVAENGYSIEIRGPEEFSQEFDSNQVDYSFRPGTAGNYSIEVIPGGEGLISNLIGQLTGSEGLAAETVEVVADRPRWKSYCEEAGYSMDSIDGQINCIESDIVPECFEGEPGESCQVRGQSLCSNLLGLNYNLEEAKCE